MQSFIAMSLLTSTEGFGSQMSNFAALYAIAKKSGHRIVFLDHWIGGKGLLLNHAFDDLPLQVLPPGSLPADTAVSIVEINIGVVVDTRLFDLDPDLNYDFHRTFNSHRYWSPLKEQVLDFFRFKPAIAAEAAALLAGLDTRGRKVVSLHVRRTDYLGISTYAHLSMDYYASACARFKGEDCMFLVFSDDIEWCRQAFSRHANFAYASTGSPYVDMCAMSLCDHNIIANSSFSIWGALLNRNTGKKVICPSKYFRDDETLPYFNHAWFPPDWIPLDDLYA